MKLAGAFNNINKFRRRSTFAREDGGAILVELSISILCWCVIIFGLLEICSDVYAYTVLADAANEGVHYAVLNSSDQSGAESTVRNYASNTFHNMSGMGVSVTYPDGVSTPPARVAVSISYQYVPYLSLVMRNPPTMHAYAEGRLVR